MLWMISLLSLENCENIAGTFESERKGERNLYHCSLAFSGQAEKIPLPDFDQCFGALTSYLPGICQTFFLPTPTKLPVTRLCQRAGPFACSKTWPSSRVTEVLNKSLLIFSPISSLEIVPVPSFVFSGEIN
jgi:hypothetical protein